MTAADDLARVERLLWMVAGDLEDVVQRRNQDSLRRAVQRVGIARQLVAVLADRKDGGDAA